MRSRWYATIVAMTWAVGPTLGPGSAAEPADPRDKPPAGLPEALLQQTKPIFDGKSLDGWTPQDKASAGAFKIDDGCIFCNGAFTHLFYSGPVNDHNFKNFELRAEFKKKQLQERNGEPVSKKDQQFLDMVDVPFWTGSGPFPSVKVRMDFRGPDVGDFVYHCHILEHEDGGMMATIRVNP